MPRRPQSDAAPQRVYSCYADGAASAEQLAFEKHEWEKHGVCAGMRDAADFFGQVCELSRGPLSVMAKERDAGARDLDIYARRLEGAGYPVFATDQRNSQVELSACAGLDARWVLAKPSEFGVRCSDGSASRTINAPAAAAPISQQCVRSQKGPACTTDSDCGFSGCVRCAKSGFCTDVRLQ